jgi:hydroxymethylglutaryl-CoA lyase
MINPTFRFGSLLQKLPRQIKSLNIVEVGPRDGLQNEKKILSLEQRASFIQLCQSIGLNNIEVGSFVNGKKVPQLANTEQLLQHLDKKNGYYSVITPNMKGCIDASKVKGIDEVVFIISTSDSFNKKNIGSLQSEMWKKYADCVAFAKENGWKIRGSISCCFTCPYEGLISKDKVFQCISEYLNLGVDFIDIADTIGTATPSQVSQLFKDIFDEGLIINKHCLAGHFHDSNGFACDNILAAFEQGVTTFHSSLSGIGGCPFSPTRVGNVSTEKVVAMCLKNNIKPVSRGINGVEHDISISEVTQAGKWIQNILKE